MLLLALLMVLTDPGGHGPPPIARLTEHGLEMLCRAANGSTALKNIQAGQEDFVAEKAGSKQVYYDNVDKDDMLASKVTAKKWRSFVKLVEPADDQPRAFCAKDRHLPAVTLLANMPSLSTLS